MFIKPNDSIRQAINTIELSENKIALVIDGNQKLVGTVTDGDVRRALINGISLNDAVQKIMNKNPIVMTEGLSVADYVQDMKSNLYKHLPVVDKKGKFLRLITIDNIIQYPERAKPEIPIVIMAGGKGLRLRPITEQIPKPMIEINGKPMLEHLISHIKVQGFKDIILSVNYKKEIIYDYFKEGKDFGINLTYIEEQSPLGTAGSLGLLSQMSSSENFLVMNADLVTNINLNSMYDYHIENDNDITICVRRHDLEVPFGVVNISDGELVIDIVEKPIYSFNVSAGIYILNARIVKNIDESVYLDMPDLIRQVLKDGAKVGAFSAYEMWYDVGRIDDLNKVKAINVNV